MKIPMSKDMISKSIHIADIQRTQKVDTWQKSSRGGGCGVSWSTNVALALSIWWSRGIWRDRDDQQTSEVIKTRPRSCWLSRKRRTCLGTKISAHAFKFNLLILQTEAMVLYGTKTTAYSFRPTLLSPSSQPRHPQVRTKDRLSSGLAIYHEQSALGQQ